MWNKLSAEIPLGLGFHLKEKQQWENAESLPTTVLNYFIDVVFISLL